MSVRDEITRLETAKSDIETAIETCGVNVPDTEKISAYASYIRQIPSAIFSELNAGPFGGKDAFIRTIEQTDGVIEATTGGLVSSSLSGLAPKIGTASSATISKQADEWVLTSTKGATPTWRKLPVNAFKNDNTTYTLSGALDGNAFVSTLTPSSGSSTIATVPAMIGASSTAAGKAGLVPAPAKNNEGKFLRGDGTWAIPSKSENSYYLYTQYQNSTDFYPNYKAYLKWIANDVAAFHFTDGTYKFKADLADSVPWTGVTGRPTALSEFTDDILANHYLPLSGGQLTGNLTLYAGSGNSPYIRFQRGSNKADTLCDWTIVDEGGYLIFREGVNGAEEDVLKICGSANTSAFTGSVSAASFVGSLTGNADTSTYATYLGTSSDNYSKATLDAALGDKYSSSVARTKNTVLAAPNGQNGNATFRALVAADLPSHNHSSAQITSLTSYTKATKNGSLATTDTLNSALGKLEYKADLGKSAYDIISAAYDGDGVIENLTEILKVLEGISDTDTITSIIGKYLPLTGGSLSSEAYISWTDRGAWGNSSAVYPYSYGGLSWSGTSDWIKLYGKEESSDKLNLIIEFGDDSGHDIKLIDNGTERIVMHSGNYTSYTVEKDGTGATGTWAIDISGNAATATNAGNADTLDSYHANTGHTPFGKIPTIATDGVMEIGKHIDFHYDNTAGKDYSTRLYCQGEYGNSVKLPTTNGTLALTSQIPSTLANPEALTIFGVAYDGSAAKTVTATTMISTLSEGTSDVTDKTEILTSYASDNGFADSAAQNVVYKRKASKLYNYINKKLKDDHAGLDKVGTVTSVTVTGDNGLSGTGTVTTSGTITLSNSGVRSTTINGNYLRVNTNGTNADLTIPYATTANSANWLNPNSDLTYGASGLQYFNATLSTRGEANTNGTPTNDWYHIIRMNHANKGGYYVDLAACFHSSQLHYRRIANGTNYGWVRLLDYGMTSSPKAVSHTNWSGTDDRSSVIPTLNFLSYWNGAYNSSNSSNLTYCANGTILGSNNYTSYVNETNFPGINKTGTVTSVATGTGLTGGTITSSGTISINSDYQTYISNGNTAYGWGNHASAKYMKAVGRHSGSMDLNKVDSTMSVVTEIRPSEITTTNLPSDYGTAYGCMISARDGNSNYGHGKMQILGCNKKFWMRATQGAGEANDGTWCRLALTSDIPSALKNPNAIKFKNTSGTEKSYDGSNALDLTGGINYAASSGKISDLGANDVASATETKRNIWFSYDDGVTGRPALSDNLTFQASTNTLFSTNFNGNLIGNASSATKATQDSDGNTINSTYLKKSGGTLTGALTFANGTWNVVGDDAAIGDYNTAGSLGLKSINNNIPSIGFHNSSNTLLGTLKCDAGTLKWNANIIIDSGNIGSQSVNYSASTGSLYTGSIGNGSDTHASALQSYFNSYKSSIPRNSTIGLYSSAYGNGSQYMGYFLSGYNDTPYGGFFVAHYDACYYVGISYGKYNQQSIITSSSIGSQSVNYANSSGSSSALSGGSIATWGTLTAANGYTNVCTWDTGNTTGAFSLAGKGGQMSLQLDGFFYQNEGKYLVLDANNYTTYTVTKTGTGASGNWGINITGNAATATSATNADQLDGYDSSAFAKIGTYNNLTHSGNEFTFASSAFSGDMWINYRTASGSCDGAITGYYFGDGKGGSLAKITSGNFSGNSNSASKLILTSCYGTTTNGNLWSTIKTGTASYLGTATIYEVYNNGGPDTYGEVLDIVSVHNSHWQPQLWFGAGKGGRLRYRNKEYNDNSWGDWKTVAWTSEIPSVGNGTVTINQAGASKGSFTLNQSTAATINLTDTNYYHTPSYSSGLSIASGTGVNTMYVPNAGASQSGVVNTGAQTFAGEKTFSSIRLRSTSTTNYGGYLYFGDGSYSYITESSDDAMTIYSSKGVTISTANSTAGTINLKSALSDRTSASTSYPGVVCDGMYLKSALYHIGSVYKLQSSTSISVSYGYGISGVTISSSKPREGKCTITVTNNSGFSIYVHTPHLVSLFTDAGGGSCYEHGFAYIQTGVTFPKSVSSGSTLSFSVIYGYMHTQKNWTTNDFTKSNDNGGFNCGVYVSRYV